MGETHGRCVLRPLEVLPLSYDRCLNGRIAAGSTRISLLFLWLESG